MKKRQILAVLLATTCAASMAVSASAEAEEITLPAAETEVVDGDDAAEKLGNWHMDVDTTVQPASLKVTLPTSTTVLVNPYRMEVKIDDTNTSYDTVLSPEMEIINDSECAIKVGVKGMVVTYKKVDVSDTSVWKTLDTTVTAAADIDVTEITLADPDGAVEGGIKIDEAADVLTDGKTYATSAGYVLTVKYTKPTYATKATETVSIGDCTKKGSLVVTGYTASSDIKIATAKMKDPDIEKTNSLYMYVEGSLTSNTYAAFDKASNAGVKDTKTGVMSTVGQVVLSSKEASGTVLYLAGGETGYARVSGQAATAPTNPWSSLKDKFDTSLTFVIDAVANPEPAAPVVSAITLTGSSVAYTFDATKTEATATATFSAGSPSINVAATSGDLTPTISATGAIVNEAGSDLANGQVVITGVGEVVITVSFTDKGKTTTYKITVTVS